MVSLLSVPAGARAKNDKPKAKVRMGAVANGEAKEYLKCRGE